MPTKYTIDFNNPEFYANPYPFYHQLRDSDPIHWAVMPPPLNGMWICTRYKDIVSILKEARLSKRWDRLLSPEQMGPNHRAMLFQDPPDHTRLRSLVAQAFTPKRTQLLQSKIETIVNHLIDQVLSEGKMDFIDKFALPLPVTVIAELLGVPVEDRHEFQQWTQTIVRGGDGARSTEEATNQSLVAQQAINDYFQNLVDLRRREPSDDLISALIAARDLEDRLSEDELLQTCNLLLIAGFETTVNLMGNGLLALLRHPEQLTMLREDPGLITSAIEEMLRFDSPVQRATFRIAAEEFNIGDVQIKQGQVVSAVIGAANRDPEIFAEPDRFDITRSPNPHVGFGLGIHFCLGAPLARLEGRIAFTTLLNRLPNLCLGEQDLEWSDNTFMHGLRSLSVQF